MPISDDDLGHLRRCVELARVALGDGDEPFGSQLVGEDGTVLFADRNRVKDGDHTRHPEFAIARWAVRNLGTEQRSRATVYTSGEHCPMCSAAHAWVGLGRIVYAASAAQLTAWLQEWGAPPPPGPLGGCQTLRTAWRPACGKPSVKIRRIRVPRPLHSIAPPRISNRAITSASSRRNRGDTLPH